MVLRFNQNLQLVADMEHFQYDTFIARFRNSDLHADAYISFSLDEKGNIDQFKMKMISPDSDLSFEDLLLKRR